MSDHDVPSGAGPMFDVAADAYDRLMGRYLPSLALLFADAARVAPGERALDVGCGPGGLTRELVTRLGADHVAAVDPSPPFVAACRERNPGVDVRSGTAEQLGWSDATFDVTAASLVIGFMRDPAAGVAEMRRVTRPGGRVALCFWDIDRMPLLTTYWAAMTDIDPQAEGEAEFVGRREGDLPALLAGAGLTSVVPSTLTASAAYADADDWWSSFTGGVGPAGAQYRRMSEEQRATTRLRAWDLLGRPEGEFTLDACAWCAVGEVPT